MNIKKLASSVVQFFQCLFISSFLGPNILLRIVLYNTLTMYLPHCDRPELKPMSNNTQNYSSLYNKRHIFKKQTGLQKVLGAVVAGIPEFNLLLVSSGV
jgi:hypothetical protein